MSFSVDQFMQVKCKLTLTSESESSESEASETIHTNNEQVRLCKSVQLDANNQSTLIVMVCSNETSNNHILAYYIERPQLRPSQAAPTGNGVQGEQAASNHVSDHQNVSNDDKSEQTSEVVALTKLTKPTLNSFALNHSQLIDSSSASSANSINHQTRSRIKPRVIVKQIYYHTYNEDIVAICLNQNGTKLVLINASSTIYIIPIKNILLNLHAQQLRSSQGRSMCFYDASVVKPCAQRPWCLSDPVDAVIWEPTSQPGEHHQHQPLVLLIANREGKLTYISLDDKREICSHHVNEPIRSLEVIKDGQNRSLLITCASFNQYRQVLDFSEVRSNSEKSQQQEIPKPVESQRRASLISLSLSRLKTRIARTTGSEQSNSHQQASDTDNASGHSIASKPLLLKLPFAGHQAGQVETTAKVIQQVFTPSASHLRAQSSLSYNEARDRPQTLLGYQSPNLISMIDVLGASRHQASQLHYKYPIGSQNNHGVEPRLLRFYSSKNHSHPSMRRAQVVYKLDSLEPDELITNLILTERFIAFTTDRERCIINSRNCCRLKSSSSGTSQATSRSTRQVNPLVKEISFNHEERIMLLIKSPISNDHDDIIDSFLLVTTRSIYSIEARHDCRELFINLIDTHLAIKRTLFMSKAQITDSEQTLSSFNLERLVTTTTTAATTTGVLNHSKATFNPNSHHEPIKANYDTHRNAESELLINNFLQHREVYEKICHDSLAFSALFKLELPSLYEAYGDRLLQRNQLILANRFYQMASLDHKRILAKYIRVGFLDAKRKPKIKKRDDKFNEQQKHIAENIFIEMMTACLDDPTDDSCRLWFNYIHFYLGYIASLEELQSDILRMTETFGDCRLAISLYKAIHRGESLAAKRPIDPDDAEKKLASLIEKGPMDSGATTQQNVSSPTSHKEIETMDENIDPLASMDQVENLANLFKNEFLMRLLDKTLDLLPQHVDLDALIIATMC